MLLICDNQYQLLLAEALIDARVLAGPKAILTLGGSDLVKAGDALARRLGIVSLHADSPSFDRVGPGDILRAKCRLLPGMKRRLGKFKSWTIFNDLHPLTALLHFTLMPSRVMLTEEGVGLHRTRRLRVIPALRRMRRQLPSLHFAGRLGEAPWVDTLLVSTDKELTRCQRRKHIYSFDLSDALAAIARRHASSHGLEGLPEGNPLLLFVGQPLCEDAILSELELADMLKEIAKAISAAEASRLSLAYKPHPRERRAGKWAELTFGVRGVVLPSEQALETLDFKGRVVLGIGFSSGGLRSLALMGHRTMAIAGCFERLRQDQGGASLFEGVELLASLEQLVKRLKDFTA